MVVLYFYGPILHGYAPLNRYHFGQLFYAGRLMLRRSDFSTTVYHDPRQLNSSTMGVQMNCLHTGSEREPKGKIIQWHISKFAQNFFKLASVQACTSLYELVQVKKTGKHHKCQSNMFFLLKVDFRAFFQKSKVEKMLQKVDVYSHFINESVSTFSLFHLFTCASRKVKKVLYNLLM
jgi:hypothetical protein